MFCNFAFAESTAQTGQTISAIRFDGSGKHLYFESADGKWISDSCESKYIWVRPEIEGQKEIMSLGLAAKMSGKKVWFSGKCSSSAGYFEATYITIL